MKKTITKEMKKLYADEVMAEKKLTPEIIAMFKKNKDHKHLNTYFGSFEKWFEILKKNCNRTIVEANSPTENTVGFNVMKNKQPYNFSIPLKVLLSDVKSCNHNQIKKIVLKNKKVDGIIYKLADFIRKNQCEKIDW